LIPPNSGDHPVEGDYQDLMAVYPEPLGVEDPLNAVYEAERLAAARSGHAANRVCVRTDEGRDLRASYALVPRFGHRETLSRKQTAVIGGWQRPGTLR